MQSIAKLKAKTDFFHVNPHRITFKPFPGKYPTRWAIVIESKQGNVIFSYVGKPNQAIAAKVQRFLKTTRGVAMVSEFDRLGAFKNSHQQIPRKEMRITYISTVVNTRYYPWGAHNGDFFSNWYKAPYNKLFKLGKKAIFVYSQYNSLLSDERRIELCRSFRRWLQVTLQNIAKSK